MQINKIEIENFKLFKEQTFEFNYKFNLIVGINGSGKTSLLRAIAVALGGWANAYIKSDKNLRPIEDKEIREIQIDNRFDKSKTTSIKAFGNSVIVDKNGEKKQGTAIWKRERVEGDNETILSAEIKYGNWNFSYPLNLKALGSDILTYIENDNTFDLPIIAFYECNRLWIVENELNVEESAQIQYSRFDPYKDCFHTGANHKAIGDWLLKEELSSLQNQKKSSLLEAIQKVARIALENCINIKFDFEASRVMVEFEDNIIIPFEHLSDGQRTVLGLFCDIARRMSILNPHLSAEDSLNGKGVVLIDELDLHLHPRWQRKIIDDLKNIFPNIQFIATTHSPHLIQDISPSEIIILEKESDSVKQRKLQANQFGFKGWSVEEILSDIMDLEDTRTEVFNKMLEEYEKAIEKEDYKLSKEIYKKLDKLLHPNNHLRELLKFDLISIKDDE